MPEVHLIIGQSNIYAWHYFNWFELDFGKILSKSIEYLNWYNICPKRIFVTFEGEIVCSNERFLEIKNQVIFYEKKPLVLSVWF